MLGPDLGSSSGINEILGPDLAANSGIEGILGPALGASSGIGGILESDLGLFFFSVGQSLATWVSRNIQLAQLFC